MQSLVFSGFFVCQELRGLNLQGTGIWIAVTTSKLVVCWPNFDEKAFESYINCKDKFKLLLLLVLVYEIHVHTGAKLGAGTDFNVYINLIGTRGDAGKRKLHRSKNNNVKFQHGQVK